jgi:hypothetical protein
MISGITQVESGAMLSTVNGYYFNIANTSSTAFAIGTPDATVAPIITCNPRKGLAKHQYANGNCFALPTTTSPTIGNTRMPYLAGPIYWNSDIAAQKTFAVTEHQKLDLRFTAKNFLNHDLHSFQNGDQNMVLNFTSAGVLSNASTFGYTSVRYGQRIVELSAKFNF